jgi:hypothetical protein
MTDQVLIKKIGCTEIWLRDDDIDELITIPAYRISTNADVDSIYIKKTTDEADQIAICKAATDIENQIKAKAENLEKLKQIAEKCK